MPRLAAAEYKRAHGVEAAGALSKEDIEKRRAAAVTADAEVKVAAAQLAEYQARLSHTQVRAPADGVVLTAHVEVGQIATPGGTATVPPGARFGSRNARAGRRAGSAEPRGGPGVRCLPDGCREALRGQGAPAGRHHRSADPPGRGAHQLCSRIRSCDRAPLRAAKWWSAKASSRYCRRPRCCPTRRARTCCIVNADNRRGAPGCPRLDTNSHGLVIATGLTGQERVIMTAAGFLRVGERVEVAPRAKARRRMRNISAWAIRHPVLPLVLFVVLTVRRHRLLHPPAHQPEPGHRLSDRRRLHLLAGRSALGDRDADPAEGRGLGRRHRQRAQHRLRRERGQRRDRHRVPDRHADRSGGDRRARCGVQGARRSAAGHPGAAGAAGAGRRRPDRVFRGQHHADERAGAVLVRRQRPHQAPAGRARASRR